MLYDNEEKVKDLLAGSLFLGGGGGGSPEEGYERAMSALKKGDVELISLSELHRRNPEGRGYVVTFAGVGSPATEEAYYSDQVYPRITELLGRCLDGPVIGVIPCEIGASSSFEPFIPAVLLGVPVIDAPCDGRAHPLGTMGSLGLECRGDHTVQAAAGGREGTADYLEIFTEGTIKSTAALVRNAAALAGGAVAVCRNPVSADYLETAGAKGAYALAAEIGRLLRGSEGTQSGVDAVLKRLGGKRLCRAVVSNYRLSTANALDYGKFSAAEYEVSFCNEFMTVDSLGRRLCTFPDLITAFDAETGAILSSAEIREGREILLCAVPRQNLPLGAGLRNKENYRFLEEATGQAFIRHLGELFAGAAAEKT